MPKIVCVVPTIRPERIKSFGEAWAPLFAKHGVTLVVVWDGDRPSVTWDEDGHPHECPWDQFQTTGYKSAAEEGLICRHTDGVRNLGFLIAADMGADFILTLDDDVVPPESHWKTQSSNSGHGIIGYSELIDPIQAHLDALARRVPISWMNTAHDTDLYLRGVPYNIRDEAPVMLSHGVWVGTPDFDGETQLRLEQETAGDYTKPDGTRVGHKIPYSLPYFVGPIPRGVRFPLCGMNVMIRKEALPYFYFAPMGPDSGFPDLNRFADIFMGCFLKSKFDELKWACYTGASTVLHTRASDARKNVEQEKLGRKWLDECHNGNGLWSDDRIEKYFADYADRRWRWEKLIREFWEKKK